MLSKISIAMMVAYPLVAYIALLLEQTLFTISYILLSILFVAFDKCRQNSWLTAILLFFVIAMISYLVFQQQTENLIYLPPVFILLSLFVFFSQSLINGQTPLITRYAMLLGDKLEDRHLHYYRILTILWSVFFLLMALTSILLALFAHADTWSLFSHIISYLLIGSFFIIEFVYRKHHFAGEAQGSFFHFIQKIIKIRPGTLAKSKNK